MNLRQATSGSPARDFRADLIDIGRPTRHQFVSTEIELRRVVNTIRPVNLFPLGILDEIFTSFRPRIHRRYLPLIRATYVSRFWRNMISSTPDYWMWVNPKWPQPFRISLQLSGSVAIEIEVSRLRDLTPDSASDLLPRSERATPFIMEFSAVVHDYCPQVLSGF